MQIVTRYKTNASGRSQIIAKSGGKQKTISFDSSKSFDWNHGTAAGALILHMHAAGALDSNTPREYVRSMDGGYSTHIGHDNARHTFEI